MKVDSAKFRVQQGKTLDLASRATLLAPLCKPAAHYAANHQSVLLIFQAMDSAGKDGAIQHVMSGINSQGCQVFSFKHPGEAELQHDFLWRTTRDLPERGRIGIFNRSYFLNR